MGRPDLVFVCCLCVCVSMVLSFMSYELCGSQAGFFLGHGAEGHSIQPSLEPASCSSRTNLEQTVNIQKIALWLHQTAARLRLIERKAVADLFPSSVRLFFGQLRGVNILWDRTELPLEGYHFRVFNNPGLRMDLCPHFLGLSTGTSSPVFISSISTVVEFLRRCLHPELKAKCHSYAPHALSKVLR